MLLPYALFAYNTATHSLHNETPFYLQHGRQARGLADIAVSQDLHQKHDVPSYAKELVEKLREVHERVREILTQVNEGREEDKDEVQQYLVGDKVLLFQPQTKRGLSRKLVRRWTGPYTVIEKHSNVTYTIGRDGVTQKVNLHRLRPFKQEGDGEKLTVRYARQLELAEREVDAITEAVKELLERKEKVMQQQQSASENMKEAEAGEEKEPEEGVLLQAIVGLTRGSA